MSADGYMWQASSAHPDDRRTAEHLRAVAFVEGPSPEGLYRITCDPNDYSPGVGIEVAWDQLVKLRNAIDIEEKRRRTSGEQCVCDLIEVGVPGHPEFIRSESNGCLVHPDPWHNAIEEAKRRARMP